MAFFYVNSSAIAILSVALLGSSDHYVGRYQSVEMDRYAARSF